MLSSKSQIYCLSFFDFEYTITAAIRYQPYTIFPCLIIKTPLKIDLMNDRWQKEYEIANTYNCGCNKKYT